VALRMRVVFGLLGSFVALLALLARVVSGHTPPCAGLTGACAEVCDTQQGLGCFGTTPFDPQACELLDAVAAVRGCTTPAICPCAGRGKLAHRGVRWQATFHVTSCTGVDEGLHLLGTAPNGTTGTLEMRQHGSTVPQCVIGVEGRDMITIALEPAEAAACLASLETLAAEDGLACP
jgi:hypothetical protein